MVAAPTTFVQFGQKWLMDKIGCYNPSPNPKIVKLLFDQGFDINVPSTGCEAPLNFMLRENVDDFIPTMRICYYENLLRTVELLLNENLDFEGQEQAYKGQDSITTLALKLDMALLYQQFTFETDRPATMMLNNAVITHSRHAEGATYALNFLLPLLIECGYPVNRDDLLQADGERLAPSEYEYVQHVLDRPRGLSLMCRDALRNHFKGRKIWYYLDMIHVPKSVKDFILLKQDLLMLER